MSNELTPREEPTEPADTDRNLLASLPQSVRTYLKPIDREFTDPIYGYDFEFSHYELDQSYIPPSELRRARELIAPLVRGCDKRTALIELTRLKMTTVSKAESQEDLNMRLAVYAEELTAYPTDCVVQACRKWTRMEKFFPAWAELKEILDRLARKRLALWRAVAEKSK